jgi:hypothetical protein
MNEEARTKTGSSNIQCTRLIPQEEFNPAPPTTPHRQISPVFTPSGRWPRPDPAQAAPDRPFRYELPARAWPRATLPLIAARPNLGKPMVEFAPRPPSRGPAPPCSARPILPPADTPGSAAPSMSRTGLARLCIPPNRRPGTASRPGARHTSERTTLPESARSTTHGLPALPDPTSNMAQRIQLAHATYERIMRRRHLPDKIAPPRRLCRGVPDGPKTCCPHATPHRHAC